MDQVLNIRGSHLGIDVPPTTMRDPESLPNGRETDDTGYDTIDQRDKKSGWGLIEKRYRSNLNDKIAELRDSVPALRIMSKASTSGDCEDRERDELEGLAPARKLNKATVLVKATEYIRHLEKKSDRLVEENRSLSAKVAQYEKLHMRAPQAPSVVSRDSGYASLHRSPASIVAGVLSKGPPSFLQGLGRSRGPSSVSTGQASELHRSWFQEQSSRLQIGGLGGLGGLFKNPDCPNDNLHSLQNAATSNGGREDGSEGVVSDVLSQAESDWNISDGSYDCQEPRHPFELIRRPAAKVLLDAFIVSRSNVDATRPSKDDGGSRTNDSTSSTASQPPSTSQLTSATDDKPSRKRKQVDSSSEGDEDGGCRVSKRLAKGEGVKPERLLACPFCKNDPVKFRVCYKYVLKNTSRLKQHLERCHRIPPHCSACSEEFKSEHECRVHERSRTCEVQPERIWHGVAEQQWSLLKGCVSRFKTREENWYIIYGILFPDAPRPSSPYVDIPGFSEDTQALVDFASIQGPAIIASFVQNALPLELRPHEDTVQAFVQFLLPDAVGMLLETWESRSNSSERTAADEVTTTESPNSSSEHPVALTSSAAAATETDPAHSLGQLTTSEELPSQQVALPPDASLFGIHGTTLGGFDMAMPPESECTAGHFNFTWVDWMEPKFP